MSKKKIEVFEFEGKRISFDFGDGEMINATEIVKAFKGKRLRNFTAQKQTKDFIKVLEKSMNTSKGLNPSVREKAIRSVRGGKDISIRGTWYEKRLALKLAAWLSPEFELWVFDRIHELLTKDKTSIDSDSIVIDKKTFQFMVGKHKDEKNNFDSFLHSLIASPEDD